MWYINTVYTVAQLSIGTFDVNVSQNGVCIREINKLSSVATVTIYIFFLFILFSLCQNSSQHSLDLFASNEFVEVSKCYYGNILEQIRACDANKSNNEII